MKKRATPAPSSTPTTEPSSRASSGRDPNAQDLVGNQALGDQLPTTGEPESLLLTEAEEAPAKEADPASRPKRFKKGLTGALIGDGKPVDLMSAATEGSVVATVTDGTPCRVVEYTRTDVKVKARSGKKNVEGWVPAAIFSDQPDLYHDEDDKKLMEDLEYNLIEGDHSPKDGEGPTAQGGLGDCFFIASLAALNFANPDFAKGMITYDPKTKRYTVRFHEEVGRGRFEPVDIVVDGFLPTAKGSPDDPAYAGDPNSPLWGAIAEKAYAKWKGGYDVLGEGGGGAEALQDMTGVRSRSKNPASMTEDEVIPYFKSAKTDNLAIYAGVINAVEEAKQSPLTGAGSGPYTGSLKQSHSWNEIEPGSLEIADTGKGKVGRATDTGTEGDKEAAIEGTHVEDGKVDYKGSRVSVTYVDGKAPAAGKDLEVAFSAHGVVLPSKMLIGNHAYAFVDVVDDDKLQFYNPWGSYQPKPITPAEFLQFFDSLATNQVPREKKSEG